MHKAVKYAQLVFVASVGGAVAIFSQRWNAEAATGLILTIAVVTAVLGFAPPYLSALIVPKIRAEIDAAAARNAAAAAAQNAIQAGEMTSTMVAELDAMRLELRRAINSARSEGQLDGVLAERLGRTADDPPRPHRSTQPRQRRFDPLNDSGTHLRPVKD